MAILGEVPARILAAINRDMEGRYELQRLWNEAGLKRIDTLYYKDGRHKMLNETNRDEVTADIIGWLDSVVG